MFKVLGSCHSILGLIPSLGVKSNGIAYKQIEISNTTFDYLSIMCGLHDVTPSLMRVCLLEHREGCVAQCNVHKVVGLIA